MALAKCGTRLCARRRDRGWFHFQSDQSTPQHFFLQICGFGKGCFCDAQQAAGFLWSGESR